MLAKGVASPREGTKMESFSLKSFSPKCLSFFDLHSYSHFL